MTSSRVAIALIAGLTLTGAARTANAQSKVEIQGMDGDHDGVVTRAEWRGPEGAFRLHDTNRDGVLSGTEVWDAREIRARGDFNDWTARGFNGLDHNRDNRITLDEWRFNREEFRIADRNHDNVISRSEFLEENRAIANRGELIRRSAAYQAGFERGQIEGRAAGREDRDRNQGWDLEGQRELESADSGYDPGVGSRPEYQSGYREGFRAAYPEGWERR
jgi:Ca2+-binding EF-hand superfamily protein